MNVQTDRALLPAGEGATRYLTVTITAPESSRRRQRAPLNVSLVLDRSGSMGGRKIDLAKAAADHAIKLLDARDRLAVICYDHEVDTLLGSAPASAEAKALAQSRLAATDARGNTNLSGGWLRGAEEAGHPGDADVVRRVLLLSDGLANEGEINPDVLAEKARALRTQGIVTSTFGLGADFDEVLMSRLSTEGGGHFYFIEQPQQIADLLASELGDALDVVARDVRLVVTGDESVEVAPLTGYVIEGMGQWTEVQLGDLTSGQELTVVIAVRCQPRGIGEKASISLRLTDQDRVLYGGQLHVEWEAAPVEVDAAQAINEAVLAAAARQIASRARKEAIEANRRGRFDVARKALARAVDLIRSLRPGAAALDSIADELVADEDVYEVAMSPVALKKAHFASVNVSRDRDDRGRGKKI